MSQPTVNIEGLVGGYTGPGGKTVLPHQAVAKIDMRLVPGMKMDDAVAALKAHLAKRGYGDIEVNGQRRLRRDQHARRCPAGPGAGRRRSSDCGIDPTALAAQRRFVSRLRLYRSAAEPGLRPFRPGPRRRRACAGRVLPHRIHQPEGAGLRRRGDVVRGVPVRTRQVVQGRESRSARTGQEPHACPGSAR